MRKFEQISSLDHQMSLAGGLGPGSCTGWGQSWGPYREVGLYSEVKCIMGNGHMWIPPTD